VYVQFILIFRKAQNSTLKHDGLQEIYSQMHVYDGEQETTNPAINAFKAQVPSTAVKTFMFFFIFQYIGWIDVTESMVTVR